MKFAPGLVAASLCMVLLASAPTASACVDIDPGYTEITIYAPGPGPFPVWVKYDKDPSSIVIDCLAYAEQAINDLKNE